MIELVPVTTATITEGTDAVFNFQVATGGTVTTALELDLSITQTGSFFDESLIVKTVTIATSGMGEKTIPTLDDDTDEANGSIIVSILQGRLTPAEKIIKFLKTPRNLPNLSRFKITIFHKFQSLDPADQFLKVMTASIIS